MSGLFLFKLDKSIAFWFSVIVFYHSTILNATEVLKCFFQKIAIDIQRKIVDANCVTWRPTSLYFTTLLVSSFYNELIWVSASFRWRRSIFERNSFPLLVLLILSYNWWMIIFSISASTSRFHSNTIFDFLEVVVSIIAWVVLRLSGISLFVVESILLKVVLFASIA